MHFISLFIVLKVVHSSFHYHGERIPLDLRKLHNLFSYFILNLFSSTNSISKSSSNIDRPARWPVTPENGIGGMVGLWVLTFYYILSNFFLFGYIMALMHVNCNQNLPSIKHFQNRCALLWDPTWPRVTWQNAFVMAKWHLILNIYLQLWFMASSYCNRWIFVSCGIENENTIFQIHGYENRTTSWIH